MEATLDDSRFLALLEKLISETKNLQNNPAQGLIPKEDLASNHVLEALKPYQKENGGVLEVERISFVEGRGNVIIKYPAASGNDDRICSFVGSHLDVVPADPNTWERDPFKLIIDGDKLYGRGTTDCLGHVAVLTELLIQLAEKKPKLNTSIVVVFIANEENGSLPGIGVDQLAKEGYLDFLKRGPLFWIDAADTQPCIGTCGSMQWQLKAEGKLFHSGLPHKGINSIEFGMDSLAYIQKNFYADFPRHEMEINYKYATQSTLKATQISCAVGSLNQLPPNCTIQGDGRITPFYDVKDATVKIEEYVAKINANPSIVENSESRGPHSKYELEDAKAKLHLKWLGEAENGIACKLDSPGYKAIVDATESVFGSAKPYSIGGSLPLVRELQDFGFDVQVAGYGLSSRYHADNEYATLSDFQKAIKVFAKVITILDDYQEK